MITTIKRLLITICAATALGTAALFLYTLPGLRRLPKAQERSLNGITTIDGVEKDVCPGHPENEPDKVHFTRLSRRTNFSPILQILAHIGSMIVNVQRDHAALKRLAQAVSPNIAKEEL